VSEAENIGYFLKRTRVQPSFIFHSALTRAAETAKIAASILGRPEALQERPGLGPEDETEPWTAELENSDLGRHCVLVGHLPFLPALAAKLLTGSEDGLFLRLPTGSVLCLEREDGWCLRYLATAKVLAGNAPEPEGANGSVGASFGPRPEMRRKDRLVTDKNWMEGVLKRGKVLHLGLAEKDGRPYVVPLCYGYRDGAIYLHGAPAGMKAGILAGNPRVCFQITEGAEAVRGETAPQFTMKYRSVTGFGIVRAITDAAEKTEALNAIMDQYDGPRVDAGTAEKMPVWVARLDIESMTGKNNRYPL
jgi:nitroimidazol reductase NimA-like FMN-containing flavoprotein (pyridoxamine 5'-phosphate oxidase superfamily)/phosphohistidine phosphatase SixA